MATRGESDIPYFMWDERQVPEELAHGSHARRSELMAEIMRDARVCDAWRYLRPDDIVNNRDELFARLGWHKPPWVFVYNGWIAHGLLAAEPYPERGPARSP